MASNCAEFVILWCVYCFDWASVSWIFNSIFSITIYPQLFTLMFDLSELHLFICRHWNQELERRKKGLKPRLLVALAKCVWWRLLLHGVMFGTEVCFLVNCDKYYMCCRFLYYLVSLW